MPLHSGGTQMKTGTQQAGEHGTRFSAIADCNCMLCLVVLILTLLGISLAIMFRYAG